MDYLTNLIVCEIEYFDEVDLTEKTEFCLCSALTYADCTEELEQFYGENNITSIKMTALEEGPMIVSEHLANLFIENELE